MVLSGWHYQYMVIFPHILWTTVLAVSSVTECSLTGHHSLCCCPSDGLYNFAGARRTARTPCRRTRGTRLLATRDDYGPERTLCNQCVMLSKLV